jgi:hypothetical protein
MGAFVTRSAVYTQEKGSRELAECAQKEHQMYKRDDTDSRLRLLECWLPLAQESNLLYGWDYNAAALEALILRAAPDLGETRTLLEARVILWHHHLRTHTWSQHDGHSISSKTGTHDAE